MRCESCHIYCLTACTHGPCSARHNDLATSSIGVTSTICCIRYATELGTPRFYGDSAYAIGNYDHIVARNEPGIDDPLAEEKEQNLAEKKVRERIEQYYGQLKSLADDWPKGPDQAEQRC
jgi:hypothetical protein